MGQRVAATQAVKIKRGHLMSKPELGAIRFLLLCGHGSIALTVFLAVVAAAASAAAAAAAALFSGAKNMAIVLSPNLFQIGAASMDNPMAALTMAQKVGVCAQIRSHRTMAF
jgi:hypothetical protein